MPGGQLQDPLAFASLLSAGLITVPMIAWVTLKRLRPGFGALHGLHPVAGAFLVAHWILLIPANLYSHAHGDSLVWLFGSETYDGGFAETLTAAGLFGIAAMSAAAATAPRRRLWERGAWLAFGLAAFIVGGEEISWGQHLLHWQATGAFAAQNLQHETNVHNFVSPRLYDYLYMTVGWGMIAFALVGRRVVAALRLRPLTQLVEAVLSGPFSVQLLMTSGLLMQHEIFEELSECTLIGTAFYLQAQLLSHLKISPARDIPQPA